MATQANAGCCSPELLRLSLIALALIQRAQRAQDGPFFARKPDFLSLRDGGLRAGNGLLCVLSHWPNTA